MLMEVSWAHRLVVAPNKMLCKIIRQVLLTWVPLNIKAAILDLVCHPEKSHLKRSRPLLFDSIIGDPSRSLVITMYRCGGLSMPQFLQDEANYSSFLAVDKQGSEFSFCCGRHHKLEDAKKYANRSIKHSWLILGGYTA